MRNPHKYHYQRLGSKHNFNQNWRTYPAGHSGRGTWPHQRVQRARVETKPRHRRRY